MEEVTITPRDPGVFEPIIGERESEGFVAALERARDVLEGRSVWHLNSTATGGGVAEMLQSVLSYPAGAGIDVHWLVADGNEEFFVVTKRIHHLLHGSDGDGGPLGDAEREVYESAIAPECDALLSRAKPGDVVMLHDPQTLGFAPRLADAGIPTVWSCHVGADEPSPESRQAWEFLMPYLVHTSAQVFSRPEYRWEGVSPETSEVIPPCIDAFAPKNQVLQPDQVKDVLLASAILAGPGPVDPPRYALPDGSHGLVERRAEMVDRPVPPEAPVVCQISRWDPLKDHVGVMHSFVDLVPSDTGAHLVLAGPAPDAVGDDPEGQRTLEELVAEWRKLDEPGRERVHLCCVPMDDTDENAIIINTLQRWSAVVVQKSLAEGFGLTVAEAMWKGRPTLGSRVGGIQDQIDDDETGLLVDPEDPADFARAVSVLLADRERAERMGKSGHQHVLEEYLAPSYLTRQFALIGRVLEPAS